jgi:CSLREA domain-containing protein
VQIYINILEVHVHKTLGRFLIGILLFNFLFGTLGVQTAQAAGIMVNTATDEDVNNSSCSLREAIIAANTNNAYNGCPAGSGPDAITFEGDYTITLSSQLPGVNSVITITGNGAANTIIQANASPNTATYGIFYITGNLSVSQLTVKNGNVPSGDGGGIEVASGGILNASHVVISNNNASNGAGIYNNNSTVNLSNSAVINNTAANGAGIYANNAGTIPTTNITNSTFAGNSATGVGIAIVNGGAMNVRNSTIANNNNGGGSSAIFIGGSGTITFSNSIISNSSCNATMINGGHNIDSGSTCGFGSANNSQSDTNPQLGALTGSPAYFPLNTGSPAIDAGSNDICAAAPVNNTSQNGVTRPNGTSCDIGSVEKLVAPSFGDVPTSHPYYADIEILYANGFTGGCSTSPLLFCPAINMDRAQAAVFLLRGLVGTSYVPPSAPYSPAFGDDFSPGTWAQPWVQGMLAEGLTAGCSTSPLLYCPWEQMNRAQAAVFGMRLRNGPAYLPGPGTGTVLADVNGTEWYAGWVEEAYSNGLLPACGSSGGQPLFCPNSLVSRGLGAYMIVRARNLSMP